ncbi:MAG: alpha/beta fold hydrolase [Actinobacteria bacterium]|nr:alpha/beta fold hydrolase [Actinomycetota bacterium]
MNRSARRRHLGAVLLATALVLPTACSASGPEDTAASGSTTTAAPTTTTDGTTSEPGDLPIPALDWTPCGGPFECADLVVPVDYDDPTGPTTTIALNRRPAAQPSERIGAIAFNPGGPGASGKQLVQSLLIPEELRDRFDIVGFDPRGVGDSDPLECHSHLQEMYDADPTIEDAADEERYVEVSEEFVDECKEKYGDLLPHLGTANVARDLDRIRAALGDDQLNYVGFSYGTSIGQQYARLFPERVRTMVLDGVVDQTVDGLTAAAEQARGFEKALSNYASSCDRDQCFADPTKTVIARVISAAERTPIPAPGADRPATPGVINLGLGYALYSEFLWDQLTAALGQADEDGDGTGLVELADGYLGRDGDGEYSSGFEIYFAVSCLDSEWPDDVDDVFAAGKDAAKDSPTFGEAIVNDYARCALWPTPPQPLEPVPTDQAGLAPVLVISTTGDPATPYENGVRVAEQLPGARLITYDGEGHTVAFQGVNCVDDAVIDYLLTAEVPADDLTC